MTLLKGFCIMSEIFILIKEITYSFIEVFFTYKLFSDYGTTVRDPLFKKFWILFFVSVLYNLYWYGLVFYKTCYCLLVSNVPQPLYLFLAQLCYVVWPLLMFLGPHVYEQLFDVHWKPQKRHYFFGAWSVGLSVYIGYCFLTRELIPTNPWLTLDSFGFLLVRIFIMCVESSVLVCGIKKIVLDQQMPLIVRKQAQRIFGFLFLPVIITQPFWILDQYQLTPQNSFAFEIFMSMLSLSILLSSFYAISELLRLRNTCPAMRPSWWFWTKPLMQPFAQVIEQIRRATSLQELWGFTQTYFEKAFGFPNDSVTLYIRPTNHEHNLDAVKAVRTVGDVEALYKAGSPFCEKIKQKRILLYADIQYSDVYKLDPDAQEIRAFMERIGAEVFLPIYGEKTLVGYIIINRNAGMNKLVTDAEVEGMLAYVGHISHVIEHKQHMNPDVFEKEVLTYKHQTVQLFQELEHCHEGMRSLVETQASEAVGMIFMKQKCLRIANAEGAKLLGLPEGTRIIENAYEKPLKQLINNFKKYEKEESVLLQDAQGNPLRFSVMRDTRQTNAVVIVTRPTVSGLFNFPSFTAMRNTSDWMYVIFLQATASGKLVEKFIPATRGVFFNFKIRFLRAAFSRRPLLLQGADQDIYRLVEIYQHICARTVVQKITLEKPEQGCDIAAEIFGDFTLQKGEGKKHGALATVSSSGILFIEHVEQLSLETQELLAQFFATGFYTSFFSKQLTASDALIICSSRGDLKELVEQNRFSAALYEELSKNHLDMPLLALVPKDQVQDLIVGIGKQIAGEPLAAHERLLPSTLIETLASGVLPSSLCELQQDIKARLVSKCHKRGLNGAISLDLGFADPDGLKAECYRQGRAVLKNKKLFCALYDLLQSYVKVADFLGVDRSTAYRACKRFRIGPFDPGTQKSLDRSSTQAGTSR